MTLPPWRPAAAVLVAAALTTTALPATFAAPASPDLETPAAPSTPSAPAAPAATPDLTPDPGALQTVPLRASTRSFGSLPTMPAAPWDTDDSHTGLVPVVYTQELETDPFQLAAVTWVGDGDVTAWVRTRQDGAWSQWYELPHGDEHGPDADSAEAAGTRNGTDPLLVPASDGVQVRVDAPRGRVATDLRLDLIDPGPSTAEAPPPAPQAEPIVPVAAARPTILTRAQWGADESMRGTPPEYGEVNGAFVHHTVNANDYSEAQVPGLIRSIYLYHVQSRGWSDIGYNFIIDRFGRIWEGRYGGIDRAVVGAHTLGYNDDAFAASALGNYDDAAPSNAMLAAYARLFAWKFTIHGVNPLAKANYDGESWPAVAGHRDAASTACPGAQLYARLGTIRSGVLREMSIGGDATNGRDLDGTGRADIVARQRSDASLWYWSGIGSARFDPRTRLGVGWTAFNTLVLPGDWNGDGRDDVIARRRSDGTLWLYPGIRGSTIGAPVLIGRGWNSMSAIVGPGDWNRDGAVDLIARLVNGELWLYPGNGRGRFGTPVRLGHGWAGMTAIVGSGDWNGDGALDLVARLGNGELWLYRGSGHGGFGVPRRIGTGWNNVTGIIGSGDIDGDRVLDLVAWRSDGTMLVYPGDGTGGFRAARAIGTGWNAYDLRS
ncbi:FG-GAP-like repeat-containing protein [Jiangella anatolica]|uniref:Peptidoglycan recognition protein family domain-containing protein n=1 Tax=Jiangella anatolica TaxID=2670374 RepID=A0A2W2CJZ3_9ACTN|nr:FG-GAP-like repeat-containing protein [Jiangella anatolica]PZF80563.1 hypothetical protein C1I92_25375 [Jiangella anatolica]